MLPDVVDLVASGEAEAGEECPHKEESLALMRSSGQPDCHPSHDEQ
jgi:hypothetical protein